MAGGEIDQGPQKIPGSAGREARQWVALPEVLLEKDIMTDTRARGRPKSAEAGTRFHISIPETLSNRLVEIQRETHANSLTDVVKSALQLYAAAVDEHRNGGHVYFKRKDEEVERQLALFI